MLDRGTASYSINIDPPVSGCPPVMARVKRMHMHGRVRSRALAGLPGAYGDVVHCVIVRTIKIITRFHERERERESEPLCLIKRR